MCVLAKREVCWMTASVVKHQPGMSTITAMKSDIVWPPSLSGNHLRRTLPHVAKPIDPAVMKTLTKSSVVTLREITRDTVRTIAMLDVAPAQEGLVAPNAFSISQAHFHPEAWFRAIYADETPVGFAMLEDWSVATQHAPKLYDGKPYVALWRFMIDHRFQRLGYGARALGLLIAHVRSRPGVATMLLSFVPQENNPEGFYARFGFMRTGEEDAGELVMKLTLE